MKVGLSEGKGHPTQALDSSLPLDTEPLTVGMNCADSKKRLPNHEAAPAWSPHASQCCLQAPAAPLLPTLPAAPVSAALSSQATPAAIQQGGRGWKQQKQNSPSVFLIWGPCSELQSLPPPSD